MLPDPEPGLVIRYSFLWSHEAKKGLDDGEVSRPCVIMSVDRRGGERVVLVAPITTREPNCPEDGIPVPPKVRDYLKLTRPHSWIITTEGNEFDWPGRHIHPVPGGRLAQFDYGFNSSTTVPNMVKEAMSRVKQEKRKVMQRED